MCKCDKLFSRALCEKVSRQNIKIEMSVWLFFSALENQMKHFVESKPGDKGSPRALPIFSVTLQKTTF